MSSMQWFSQAWSGGTPGKASASSAARAEPAREGGSPEPAGAAPRLKTSDGGLATPSGQPLQGRAAQQGAASDGRRLSFGHAGLGDRGHGQET